MKLKVTQLIGKTGFNLAIIAFTTLQYSCTKNYDARVLHPISSTIGTVKSFASALTGSGTILREEWNNIIGNDVIDIPFQSAPSSTSQITTLETQSSFTANYGARIRGYISPPLNGNYTFWLSGDDAAELWLSSDDDPSHKVKIASILSWTHFREWTKFPSQQSKSVSLNTNNKYYIEVLHKQGGGAGHLSVQWRLPDSVLESPIGGSRLSPYLPAANTAYTNAAPINLNGAHDITISGKSITGGILPAINLTNCYNIRISQNRLTNSTDVGIHLYKCKNITIDSNFFTNVSSGVYAEQTSGGGIVVNYNQFLNMKGPFPRGQFVQFNNVSGANSSISYNKGENILGSSYPEDAISLYQSSGTADSPTKIKGNWIRGGGPSLSGGGIMLGDNGGSYLIASDNILVNPGEYGMAIAGGDHNSITNNSIFAVQQYFTNVGLYINNINGHITTNCTISGNQVKYFNKTNYQNDAWIAPGTTMPAGWSTNVFGANISASILPDIIITDK